jgi:hypothetical protein
VVRAGGDGRHRRLTDPAAAVHAAYARPVGRRVAIGLGALLVLLGVLWTLQGLNYLGGSAMSGVTLWAVVGPVVALGGLLLAVVGGRRRH